MVAPKKMRVLQNFLSGLPPATAARLAKAVEVDRLSDGKALPHNLILDGLRPVLRRGDASRTLTPTRIFCSPFEDLLISRPRSEKHKGRIARDAITPVWNWLGKTLAPNAMRKYVDGVKGAVFGHHHEIAVSCAAEFWPIASAAILEALSTEPGCKAAKRALGSVVIVEDAREIARLIAVGPEILEIQALLPKPAASLSEDMLFQLREIYNRILEKASDAGPYVAVVAMNRLERPWEALKLPLFVSRQTRDTLISNTDMGLVGEVIFAEMDSHLGEIRAARQPQFDANMLAGELAAFAELSMGLVKEVEMRRDGKWGQRLMRARADVAECMEAFMERAPREILAALPMHRASFSGGPRAPDLAQHPSQERLSRAINYANLIVGCRPFAAAASFGAALKTASDEVTATLRKYNEDILRELRTVDGEKRTNAEIYFDMAAELTSLLLDPDEGDLLRRRGRSAMASAAA